MRVDAECGCMVWMRHMTVQPILIQPQGHEAAYLWDARMHSMHASRSFA
jgi:hypothetical protein